MRDINLIHWHKICIVLQIHIQLDNLAEVAPGSFKDGFDVLERLFLFSALALARPYPL